MTGEASTLQQRVADRLAELRRRPREVSMAAGLGPDAIRTIISGRSKFPRGDTLAALARELDCDVGYLLGTQDSPYSDEEIMRNRLGRLSGVARMPRDYDLSLSWLPDNVIGPRPEGRPDGPGPQAGDIYTLPQYLPGLQTLHRVADESVNWWFRIGSFVQVLALSAATDLHDGDFVVVWRVRKHDETQCENQYSIRRVRIFGGDVELETGSTNPDLVDRLRYPREAIDVGGIVQRGHHISRHYVSVEGLVLRSITHFAGPEINPSWVE